MLRGLGVENISAYSQTPNLIKSPEFTEKGKRGRKLRKAPSGPFMVSRNGKTEKTERHDKVPKEGQKKQKELMHEDSWEVSMEVGIL